MDNISTVKQLLSMTTTGNYELINDIDCRGQVIPCFVTDFKGTFNGNGHIISNLTITEEIFGDAQPIALFHTLKKSEIKNVVFDNLSIIVKTRCFKPNVAALCVDCSNSIISNVAVNVICATPPVIPLIYDANDITCENSSIICNGKKTKNIKFEQ